MKRRSQPKQSRGMHDDNTQKSGGGGQSKYARKVQWLHRFGDGRWGFEIPEPKPWR